jgi:hypothetical protein
MLKLQSFFTNMDSHIIYFNIVLDLISQAQQKYMIYCLLAIRMILL